MWMQYDEHVHQHSYLGAVLQLVSMHVCGLRRIDLASFTRRVPALRAPDRAAHAGGAWSGIALYVFVSRPFSSKSGSCEHQLLMCIGNLLSLRHTAVQ